MFKNWTVIEWGIAAVVITVVAAAGLSIQDKTRACPPDVTEAFLNAVASASAQTGAALKHEEELVIGLADGTLCELTIGSP